MASVDIPLLDLLVCLGGNIEEPFIPLCHHLTGTHQEKDDEDDKDNRVNNDISFNAGFSLDDFGENGRDDQDQQGLTN